MGGTHDIYRYKAMSADRFSLHSYTQMDEDYICFQEHCSILPEMKKGGKLVIKLGPKFLLTLFHS